MREPQTPICFCVTVALVGARQHNQARKVRLDITCAGYGGITASECQQRGCCYVPVAPYIGSAVLVLPVCVYPNAGASTYTMSGNMAATGAPARLSGVALLCERGCLLGAFVRQALVGTRHAASGYAEHCLSDSAERRMIGENLASFAVLAGKGSMRGTCVFWKARGRARSLTFTFSSMRVDCRQRAADRDAHTAVVDAAAAGPRRVPADPHPGERAAGHHARQSWRARPLGGAARELPFQHIYSW